MLDVRTVTDHFAVAPQLAPSDLAAVAMLGYRRLINNRPDDEVPGQPTSAAMERAARAAGLDYVHIPVVGAPTAAQVEAMSQALASAPGPALAFCRSGTRSIVAWALSQHLAGVEGTTLLKQATAAGYNLSAVLGGV